ncbi:transmembrane protein [Citrus sinensis]|uniref:Uncharacterized protein n=2 Tax=Citrus TaxID=2706 RepID=V4RNN7_CITCL|nr:uncharacterized protein LOC18034389 [Citrus x clementina]XP_015388314.3 uncharacterized protein LOC102623199 [Citrus sinensis]ESR35973.1 hypothetical protein CICLE_v10027822mg [Citrus x clementina]KAH9655464.1 transmembrane protein [Citrus sinensis]
MATTNKLSSSCSSISSMKPNPSPRNSESKDPMRRSFSGNPFPKPSSILANSRGGFNPNTPANSPSDFPRRSSFGRENSSSMRDYEDKENSKISSLKPGRVHSPASVSKGTKNFMSPTISAASKFTTSPRKKILVERNEPLRSPTSSSEAKSQVMEGNIVKPEITSIKKKTVSFSDAISRLIEDDLPKLERGLDETTIEASRDLTITDMGHNEVLESGSGFDSELPLDLKNDAGSSWGHVTDKDCVNLDPTFKTSPITSCSTTSPVLAPLDADPLMPPYDPKTNYLSPRPQFLHYKPNPRIGDIDGKRLEESLISENLSDSEVSENLSEDSQKESEHSSDETVKEGEESLEEEEETSPIPTSTHKPKSKFFTRTIVVALLLALLFVCLSTSVTDSTVTDLSMLKDVTLSNLYFPPEITEFAQVNFEDLVRKSWLWASNYFTYICNLIFELRGMHKLGPLQYGNLTSLLEQNHMADGYLKFGYMDAVAEIKYQEYMLAPVKDKDVKAEPLEESHREIEANEEEVGEIPKEDEGADFEEQVHQDIDGARDNIDDVVEDRTEPESKEVCLPAQVVKTANSVAEIEEDPQEDNSAELEEQVHQDIDGAHDDNDEVVEDHIEPESEEVCLTPPAEVIENANSEAKQTEETTVHSDVNHDIKPQSNIDVGLGFTSLVLLNLLAVTAFFIHTKKSKITTPNATSPAVVQSVVTKKLDSSPISVAAEHTLPGNPASRNWQTEADDMMLGESCPSEMSSFKSSSHGKGLKVSSEAQSQERKSRRSYRRESLASSDISLSSYSYGSFTTYEKLPSKHGHGDDEVVTPVRRSSRIRKQVTSP